MELAHPLGDIVIEHCEKYTYLGSIFTADGSMNTVLTEHVKDKLKHLLKLIAFFQKNNDFTFYVKRKILEAAFLPTLLYGCESWLTDNVSKVESV